MSDELSQVAKALAFQPPYQASLAKRVEVMIECRDAYKQERDEGAKEIERLRRGLKNVLFSASHYDAQHIARSFLPPIASAERNDDA